MNLDRLESSTVNCESVQLNREYIRQRLQSETLGCIDLLLAFLTFVLVIVFKMLGPHKVFQSHLKRCVGSGHTRI